MEYKLHYFVVISSLSPFFFVLMFLGPDANFVVFPLTEFLPSLFTFGTHYFIVIMVKVCRTYVAVCTSETAST